MQKKYVHKDVNLMIDMKQNVIRSLLDLLVWFDLLVYILEKRMTCNIICIFIAIWVSFNIRVSHWQIFLTYKEEKLSFRRISLGLMELTKYPSISLLGLFTLFVEWQYATSPSTMTIHRKSMNIVKR